jgi:N6-adenosine-specific RNA methylase IME4
MTHPVRVVREPALRFHPFAGIFPLMEGAEFEELVADIRAHGVREPVWLYEGKILDGRNRHRAALVASVPCPTRTYEGDDPLAFVISANLHRRHLTESQRAMVAAKLATLKLGANQHSKGLPIGRASELLNVGERSAARARGVQQQGDPDLVRAVETGRVKVSVAADIAALPKEEQRALLAKMDAGEIQRAAKEIRDRRFAQRRAEWTARTLEISKHNSPLRSDRRYAVILADAPWDFEVYDAKSGLDSAANAHYPTMATDEIAALPVADLATRDAVLFMWSTAPHLPEALQVMQSWDFEYVTHMVWVKDKIGLGYWVRNQHELLLIGRRGDMLTPAFENRPSSVFNAARRAHSQKPDEAYEIIERMYPELPKIELFARGMARPGWAVWGNQAQGAAA